MNILTKCKPHVETAETICIHPFCLGRFICQKCFLSHSLEHGKYLIPLCEFFECTVKSKLDLEVEKVLANENKIKKEVSHTLNKIDSLFLEFETEFLRQFHQIKQKVKQDFAEPLREVRLDSKYWTHLQDRLRMSYNEFLHMGLLDQGSLVNYISAFDKTNTRLEAFSKFGNSLSNESSSLNKENESVLCSFQEIDQLFIKIQTSLKEFHDIHTSIPMPKTLSYRASFRNSLMAKSQSSRELTTHQKERNSSHIDRKGRAINGVSLLNNINSSQDKKSPRNSKNYPFIKGEQSFLSKFLKKEHLSHNISLVQNQNKEIYVLENLKEIDSGHEGVISSALYIKELNLIATGGREGKIKLWDASTLRLVRTFEAHQSKIYSLKYISKRNILVSASRDTLIKTYKLDTDNYESRTLFGHFGPVTALEYAKNIDNIISGSSFSQKVIKIWDLNDMSVEFEFTSLEQNIYIFLYVESKHLLFAGCGYGIVQMFDLIKKTLKFTINTSLEDSNKSKDIITLAYEEEKGLLYCANLDGTFSIWNTNAYPILKTHQLPNDLKWSRSLFLPNRSLIILTSKDKTVRLTDIQTGETLRMVGMLEHQGSAITFIEKNQVLVTDLKSGVIKLWTLIKKNRV